MMTVMRLYLAILLLSWDKGPCISSVKAAVLGVDEKKFRMRSKNAMGLETVSAYIIVCVVDGVRS